MSEIKYYSEDGLQKLRDELHHLIAFDRPAAAAAIAEARDKGDLSENAEYDAAKEAQGHLEARISKLQDLIANARLLDESKCYLAFICTPELFNHLYTVGREHPHILTNSLTEGISLHWYFVTSFCQSAGFFTSLRPLYFP